MGLPEIRKREYDKVLIVEGGEDKYFVAQLMKKYVDWPDSPDLWPLFVDDRKGIGQVLKRSDLTTELKSATTRILGVIIDADENPSARYQSIRNAVIEVLPNMPLSIPAEGLIHSDLDNPKFGVWLMPGNTARGALEDFIEPMIPPEQEHLWTLAAKCVTHAKSQNATVRETHVLKARLYTWLAWQILLATRLAMLWREEF